MTSCDVTIVYMKSWPYYVFYGYACTWSLNGREMNEGRFLAHFMAIKSKRADVSYMVSCGGGKVEYSGW